MNVFSRSLKLRICLILCLTKGDTWCVFWRLCWLNLEETFQVKEWITCIFWRIDEGSRPPFFVWWHYGPFALGVPGQGLACDVARGLSQGVSDPGLGTPGGGTWRRTLDRWDTLGKNSRLGHRTGDSGGHLLMAYAPQRARGIIYHDRHLGDVLHVYSLAAILGAFLCGQCWPLNILGL